MKILKSLSVLSFTLFVPIYAAVLEAQEAKYKKVIRNKSLLLTNCPLVEGIKKFEVVRNGATLRPVQKFGRRGVKLPTKFKFFACTVVEEATVLLAKEGRTGGVTVLSYQLSDFPKKQNSENEGSGLSSVCPNGTRGVATGVLYKPAADSEDSRFGKPVVLLQGSNKTRASAMRVFSTNGTEVCKFTFKAPLEAGVNGNSDHYFSGWSGGCAKTGSQIAAAARSAGGDSQVYLEWKGGVCLGPVNPTSRVGGIQ